MNGLLKQAGTEELIDTGASSSDAEASKPDPDPDPDIVNATVRKAGVDPARAFSWGPLRTISRPRSVPESGLRRFAVAAWWSCDAPAVADGLSNDPGDLLNQLTPSLFGRLATAMVDAEPMREQSDCRIEQAYRSHLCFETSSGPKGFLEGGTGRGGLRCPTERLPCPSAVRKGLMRLADFIDANVDEIVQAAASFAGTLLPAAEHLSLEELQDHLPLIVQAIAKDLRTSQSAEEALVKSLGRAPALFGAPETAAQTHARLRAKGGFQIGQLVGEYRALRASVLSLWAQGRAPLDAEAAIDMVRFNEAIDQAVSESVAFFAAEVDRWRHVFLGVLGHDLRNPLNAILITSQLLSKLVVDTALTQQVHRLIRSGERMSSLLDDLLDFSRASLGLGIGIRRSAVDLAVACAEEIEVLRLTLPDREIELRVDTDARGSFDASRLREALSNLVINAVKYGAPANAIQILLAGTDEVVNISVENDGPVIPQQELSALFEPLRRGADCTLDDAPERASLGLGLFIVREIARAHGGEVTAVSHNGKTRFTIKLPREPEQEVALVPD